MTNFIKNQDYGYSLIEFCNNLSSQSVDNFIHWDYKGRCELVVEIKNTTELYDRGFYLPHIDFVEQRLFLEFIGEEY